MAKPEANLDKLIEMSKLNEGDKVKLINGDVAEFVRLKQKNFVGKMKGASYNIPVNMFVEVVEKVNVNEKRKEQESEYMTLKTGELFYISHKGEALLFKFDGISNNKIIGINPITQGKTKIDPALFGGKVSNLL